MLTSSTLLALSAVGLWSFLAYLGAQLGHVPPFLLVGLALCVCGVVSVFRISEWRVPRRTFAVGVGGIFGYHFLYFTAFQHAPAVEANLINYLWPLLIVLMSPLFLRDYPLRVQHLVGAGMGLLGAGLIVTRGSLQLDLANLPGYLYAAGAALAWSSYSLLTKRLPAFPTAAVGGFCLVSGLFSLGVYSLSGGSLETVTALTARDWIYIVLLGAGPMGLAFFVWDAALKRGDPRVIGSLAYLTPLTSTLILVVLGQQRLTMAAVAAMGLIIGGALIGSRGGSPSRVRPDG